MSDVRARSGFRRVMLTLTLGFWAVVYLFFTLRSFAVPTASHLDVQALLRLAMMPVGLLLCAGLFAAYGRLARQSAWRQAASVLLLVFVAALAYSVINYMLFYGIAGLWHAELGAVAKVTEYVTTGLFWVFGAWTALFYITRARMAPERSAAEDERVSYPEEIWVRDYDRSIRVPLSDISWFEAEGDYVRVHTKERSYLFRSTMTNLEQTFDPAAFMRIHRRIMISVPLLKSLQRRRDGRVFAELSSGAELPVGRHYLPRLKSIPSV